MGQKTRRDCPSCGENTNTNAAIVNHAHKGYSLYCNACGYNPFVSKGRLTLEDLKEIKELDNRAKTTHKSMSLPKDFTKDIPIEGRLWLYKSGITPEVWERYGIGYSEYYRRVILPVYDKGKLIWYQGRAVYDKPSIKYSQPKQDKKHVLYRGHGDACSYTTAIIVEDILSAIRVGKHIDTYSLLGTKITDEQSLVLSKYNRVVTWLDGDKAGRQGAYKIRRSLALVTETGNIATTKDPKYYSDEDILTILKDNKCLN